MVLYTSTTSLGSLQDTICYVCMLDGTLHKHACTLYCAVSIDDCTSIHLPRNLIAQGAHTFLSSPVLNIQSRSVCALANCCLGLTTELSDHTPQHLC